MKHLRLFVAAIAAVFVLNANAWDGSEGSVILKNVGSGLYWSAGNSWGTQASLVQHPEYQVLHLNDGAYTLESQVNNGGTQYYFNGSYMDNGSPVSLTITADGDYYTIANGDTYYGYDGSTTVLGSGASADTDNFKWQILTQQDIEALMATASEDNPVDVSCYIQCANFGRNNRYRSAWNFTAGSNGNGDNTNWVAEFYNVNGTASQVLTVPNGLYMVKAQSAVTYHDNRTIKDYDGGVQPEIFGNDVAAPCGVMDEDHQLQTMSVLGLAMAADPNKYLVSTDVITVADGKLTIGARSNRADIWQIFDNFQLYYLGQLTDLTPYVDALAAAVAAAEAVDGTVPEVAYEALAAVVAENNKEYATADEYTAAIQAIQQATETAKALQTEFSRYNQIKAAVLAINGDIDTTEPDATANAATTAEEIEQAVQTVRNALSEYLASANIEDAEIDLTAALIDNAAPGTNGTLQYWTNSGNPTLENELYEYWNVSGGTTKQNINTELPVGYYTLTAVAYTREGMNATLNAGENTMNIVGVARGTVNNRTQGSNWIAAGNGVNNLTFNLAEATTGLEIGLTADATTADYWMCWRSFKLTYLGTSPLSVFQARLAEAANNAQLDGPVPAAAQQAYEQTVAENAAKNTTIEECLASIAAIEAATTETNKLVAPYAEVNTIYEQVKAVADVEEYEELADGAHQTLVDELATIKNQIEAITSVDQFDVTTINNNLKQAGYNYAKNANPTGEAQFNLTFLLTNPDVTNCTNWQPAEGWYTEQPDGNSQVMSNDAATSEDGTKTKFYEYWSNPAKANDLFALYQQTQLPLGTYNISCYAFAQDQYAGQNSVGVFFYANDTQGSSVTTARLTEANIEFVNAEEQEVKIGLKTIAGNTYNWMGIGYVELYKVAPKTGEIADTDNGTIAAGAYGEITYDRSLLAGLNTLVLPFQTTKEEIGAATVLEYTGTTVEEDGLTLNFVETETLYPNVPYAVFVDEDVALPAFENKTVVEPTDLTVADDNFSFVGTYTQFVKNENSPIENGDYVAGIEKFKKAAGGNGLKAYRAYLKKAEEVSTEAKIAFNFGGTIVDGIEAVEILNNLSGNIYNLNGQKLEKAQKGINIVNGKKVLVK